MNRTTKHRATRTRVITGLALTAAIAVLVVLTTPVPALAADGPVVWAAPNDLGTILSNIRTWVMTILAGIATVFLTIGGVRYLMAGGDPSEVERAKSAFKSAGILLDALKWIWSLLAQAVFVTPDVTGFPQVTAISGRSLLIANSCYLLVITVAGIIIMTRDTIQARYGVAELAPRLVIGLIAANLATPICTNLISLSNGLTTALTGDGVAGTGSIGQMQRTVTAAMTNPSNALLTALIGLIILVLTCMLLVTWLVRIGVLVVLVGIAPAALACHGLPQLEGAAKVWWRAILATLGTVVLQALALHMALSVFLSPDANVPALGLPGDPTDTFNLFIVACLLWTVVKIPGLMRRYVTRSGGNNLGSYLIRVVLIQQLSRVLTRGLVGRSPPATVMPQRTPRWRRSWAYQPSGTGWPDTPAPAGPPPRLRPARPSGTGWPAVSATPPRRTPPSR